MSVYKQILNLDKIDVFHTTPVNDTTYFNINELNSTLTYGKHYFTISFNTPEAVQYQLKQSSQILFEFKDSKGQVIFSEVTDLSKSGAALGYVWIIENPLNTYDEYGYPPKNAKGYASYDPHRMGYGRYYNIVDGPCTLTVVGELEGVPEQWCDNYNIKSTFEYDIRKDLPNSSKIIFKETPTLRVSESIELDKNDSNFKRSYAILEFDKLATYSGKTQFIQVSKNASSTQTDQFQLLDTFKIDGRLENIRSPFTSGSNWVGDFSDFSNVGNYWNTASTVPVATSNALTNAVSMSKNNKAVLLYKSYRGSQTSERYELKYEVSGSGVVEVYEMSGSNSWAGVSHIIPPDTLSVENIYKRTFTHYNPSSSLGPEINGNIKPDLTGYYIQDDVILNDKEHGERYRNKYFAIRVKPSTESGATGFHIKNLSLKSKNVKGINSNYYVQKIEMPTNRRNETVEFKANFLSSDMNVAQDINANSNFEISKSELFGGAPQVIEMADNLITGSLFFGKSVDTAVELQTTKTGIKFRKPDGKTILQFTTGSSNSAQPSFFFGGDVIGNAQDMYLGVRRIVNHSSGMLGETPVLDDDDTYIEFTSAGDIMEVVTGGKNMLKTMARLIDSDRHQTIVGATDTEPVSFQVYPTDVTLVSSDWSDTGNALIFTKPQANSNQGQTVIRHLYSSSPTFTGTAEFTHISASTITANTYSVTHYTSSQLLSEGSTQFGNSQDDTHTFTGKLSGSVDAALHIEGNISASGGIIATGDIESDGTIIGDGLNINGTTTFNDGHITNVGNIDVDQVRGDSANNVRMVLLTGGITFQAEDGDKFAFNEGETNVDLLYYNSDESNFVYFDASTSRVGIGDDISPTPAKTLTVKGDISASGYLSTESHITASGDISASGNLYGSELHLNDLIISGTAGGNIYFKSVEVSDSYQFLRGGGETLFKITDVNQSANGIQLTQAAGGSKFVAIDDDHDIYIETNDGDADLVLQTGMYLTGSTMANMKVAIGDSTPNAKLDIHGDFMITSGSTVDNAPVLYASSGSNGVSLRIGTTSDSGKELTVEGNISASGNIFLEPSQTIFFNSPTTGDNYITYQGTFDTLYIASQDINLNPSNGVGINQAINYNNSADLDVNGTIYASSHITASGNISSSGNFLTSHSGSFGAGVFNDNVIINADTTGSAQQHLGALTVNYGTHTQLTGSLAANGDGYGDIVKIGGTTTVKGQMYYLDIDSTWTLTNGTDDSAGADKLLAIALGTNSDIDGMLLRGFVKLNAASTTVVGAPIYMRASAGNISFLINSTSGNIVRIVGYCLTGGEQMYFNPDTTFVEVA